MLNDTLLAKIFSLIGTISEAQNFPFLDLQIFQIYLISIPLVDAAHHLPVIRSFFSHLQLPSDGVDFLIEIFVIRMLIQNARIRQIRLHVTCVQGSLSCDSADA